MLSGLKGDSNGLEMLNEKGQLAGLTRYSHGVVFFRVISHGTSSRHSAAPATESWEFSGWTGLRETDWLIDSREIDAYIRMPS